MALTATFGMLPSHTGTGGELHYQHASDAIADIRADTYWATDIDARTDIDEDQKFAISRAREAAEDFVAKNSVDSLTLGVRGSIGTANATVKSIHGRFVLSAAGRLLFRNDPAGNS